MLKSKIPAYPCLSLPVRQAGGRRAAGRQNQKFCHLSFVICNLSFIILLSGCATVIEGTKGVLGISTKSLEEGRKDAIAKSFNYDYSTCYAKTQGILKQIDAYIYAQDKKKSMIAIYVSETDTTPVGLFFKEIDTNNTQIEVSSPSKYAKETIAKRLFAIMEGQEDPGKELPNENTKLEIN
jgi:hypothetical protein